MDAIKSGNAVLVASTYDEAEREIAIKVIGDSLKGKDQAAAEAE